MRPTIMVVDDEINILESFKTLLEESYNVRTATNGKECLQKLEEENANVILLDIMMPGIDGIETLRKIKEKDESLEVIMVTAVRTVKTAVQAMQLGAYDYIVKPFDIDEVLIIIEKALEKQGLTREVTYLRSEVKKPTGQDNIIAAPNSKMRAAYEIAIEVAKSDTTVLITGESGTGKELIARAIHYNSHRKDKPFIAVDCAALPETLIESEFFGHEKGAFTDATKQKLGKFELAHEGTLFLDEIGNLKPEIQIKILRALQEREIQRVGGTKTIKVDIRIITATNVNLKQAIKEGKFRTELYYRLNVVPIFLPSLRERKEDIPLLVNHFLKIRNREFNKHIKRLSPQAMDYLIDYNWPGNVRELQNVIERLVALGKDTIISKERLPLDILLGRDKAKSDMRPEGTLFKEARSWFEKQFILSVLDKANWNQTRAAKLLGIHRNTLILKMKELRIK
ncbi:MAG: sigma-54-dependent Fis family transcriptional regulator [Nitrospirae bacterium]|nr:sigma-54-dependent Fis family transcriptional regulator [Nitrospirota bacterium]